MSNFTTSEDIIKGALSNAGELSDGTSPYQNKAVEYLNRIYLSVLSGGNEFEVDLSSPWSWAKSKYPGLFLTELPYETGSISLTNGSTSGTFSSAPSSSLTDWYIQIDGRPDMYRITAHTAAMTAFTLDLAYGGDTGSGLSFKAFKVDYLLNPTEKILRMIGPMNIYRSQVDGEENRKIYEVEFNKFGEEYPIALIKDRVPEKYTQLFRTDDGQVTIRLSSYYSQEKVRIEYNFIPYPTALTYSSSSNPIVPRQHRITLMNAVTFWLMMDKNDDRAQTYFTLTKNGLMALVGEAKKEKQNTGINRGQLIPRLDLLRRSSKNRWYWRS